MFRPLFSASHSALLKRKAGETDNPALVQWNHQMGVPGGVFGEIWGAYVQDDGTYATPPDSDDETTSTAATTTVPDNDGPSEHSEQDHRARLASHGSHGRAISSRQIDETTFSSLPPQTIVMANKTHLWISLWQVFQTL